MTNKCQNCHVSVCSKFSQLYFCQILFAMVYSWKSYHENKKGELFNETQCTDETSYRAAVVINPGTTLYM